MFRAKIFEKIFRESKCSYFRGTSEAKEIVQERFNTDGCKEFYDLYGFYPYEIWNFDYTFMCFVYSHLKALTEFHERTKQRGTFPEEIRKLTERVQDLITNGYDFMKPKDLKKYNDVCREITRLLPGMWT